MITNYTSKDVERFWKKVNISDDPDACWEWTSAKDPSGYGLMWLTRVGYKSVKAHRISYELEYGSIPQGMNVLHQCDNPPCVNPEHLFIGTNADNVADKIRKGREKHPSGEDHPGSKLTWDQVREIRRRFKRVSKRVCNVEELSKEFNISTSTIRYIISGKLWKEDNNE